MKRIMVISDTHEDRATIRMVLDFLKAFQVDMVIHLGDYFSDTALLEKEGVSLIKVPGTWDPQYDDRSIPNRRFIHVEGWRIFLSHTPDTHYNDLHDDIKPEQIIHDGAADLFLYGHTHRAEIKRHRGMIIANPGHLSCDEARGYPLTFALMDLDPVHITISIRQLLRDDPVMEKRYDKATLKY